MRSKTLKKLCCCPKSLLFKPVGCSVIGEVELTREEIEALELKNIRNYDQITAAKKMGTSQSTFQRILSSAYAKVSDGLVNGKTIKIENKQKKNCC